MRPIGQEPVRSERWPYRAASASSWMPKPPWTPGSDDEGHDMPACGLGGRHGPGQRCGAHPGRGPGAPRDRAGAARGVHRALQAERRPLRLVGGLDADMACLSRHHGRSRCGRTADASHGRGGDQDRAGCARRSPHRRRACGGMAAGPSRLPRHALSEVVDDLNRYRPGRIVLASSAAAARRVTGIFHLARPEEALRSIRPRSPCRRCGSATGSSSSAEAGAGATRFFCGLVTRGTSEESGGRS